MSPAQPLNPAASARPQNSTPRCDEPSCAAPAAPDLRKCGRGAQAGPACTCAPRSMLMGSPREEGLRSRLHAECECSVVMLRTGGSSDVSGRAAGAPTRAVGYPAWPPLSCGATRRAGPPRRRASPRSRPATRRATPTASTPSWPSSTRRSAPVSRRRGSRSSRRTAGRRDRRRCARIRPRGRLAGRTLDPGSCGTRVMRDDLVADEDRCDDMDREVRVDQRNRGRDPKAWARGRRHGLVGRADGLALWRR
jgi:hypothetical protein